MQISVPGEMPPEVTRWQATVCVLCAACCVISSCSHKHMYRRSSSTPGPEDSLVCSSGHPISLSNVRSNNQILRSISVPGLEPGSGAGTAGVKVATRRVGSGHPNLDHRTILAWEPGHAQA